MKRIVVGITGATGVAYGVRLLEALRDLDMETHLIVSDAGKRNIETETQYSVAYVKNLAYKNHDASDLGACVSSGSFKTLGMVVAPCTIKTLSGIANSFDDNLIIRAADVTLKERRPLVLMVRETPLHKGHLRLLTLAADSGAIIMPPVPAFYHMPKTIEDLIDQTVGKILDLLDIEHNLVRRWGEAEEDNEERRVESLKGRLGF